ncbi:RhoGAP domain containing protein [Acanthamoeba castellanii str. Neff]|uniref:RhoGAP domain containing protein n=1 Tax=Acanthamoeba castellanii (strain ATCC 30010 / Neff) TaxID=1257118 RepID=L8H535_ACACF|nr:RhoGAP domain containing protein [Acanthamoeba castellanii str. Neff]ELR20589.1 RhoGAP domain containing protein [Acanthamoeba castellanii str. Neff]
MKRGLFKKGQSYSDLPISRPTNAIDRAILQRSGEDEKSSSNGSNATAEANAMLKLKQSVAFSTSATGTTTSSSKDKISLEGLMMSPRGVPPSGASSSFEDLARFVDDGDAKKLKKKEKGGSSYKREKKEKKESGSGGSKKESKKKSKEKDGLMNSGGKKNEGSGSKQPAVGKYVPPPPSAPPEWAKQLPTPMEQNRFVLDLSPDDKHQLKSGLKDLEAKKKGKAGMTKAHSSTNMKQHYTMPSIVIAAGTSNKPALSPRRRPADDIRISAPRNFRNLKVGGLFGVPLEVAMRGYPEWQVPPFLELLCLHIEHLFLSLEGIFRMAGNVDETKLFRDMVNNGEQVDLFKTSNGYVEELQVLFKEVPQYNKFTLKRILMCLSKVVEESAENKMDAPNLATIFGPSFFRPPPSAMTSDRAAIEKQVADTKYVNELTITLIKHHDTILKEVEYRPYYKYYAKVTKAYKPRTNEDLELVEGDMIVITGTAKGTLFMGESREAAGFFPMANVSLLNGKSAASIDDEEVKMRQRTIVARNKQEKEEEESEGENKSESEKEKEKEKEGADKPKQVRIDLQARMEVFNRDESPTPASPRRPVQVDSPSYLARARETFKSLDQQEASAPSSPGKDPKPT